MFVRTVPNLKEESMVGEDLNKRLDIREYYQCHAGVLCVDVEYRYLKFWVSSSPLSSGLNAVSIS